MLKIPYRKKVCHDTMPHEKEKLTAARRQPLLRGMNVEETQQLKEAGLKITTPRVKILQILEESVQHHLSAETIYKLLIEMGEDVALATVYRVLTQFEGAGLIC